MEQTEEKQLDNKEAIALSIRTYLTQIDQRNTANLEDAVRVGFALRKANTIIPHSEFAGWVKKHFHMTPADAVHYMEASGAYQHWEDRQTTKVVEEPT